MKYRLVLLTILVSVGFFNPLGILSDQVLKLLFYVCVLASLVLGALDGVSLRGVKYPRAAYLVVLVGICLSTVMASALHMQSFKVSVMTVLPYLFAYSYFYALMKLNVPVEKIMRAYLVLAGVSSIVYFANVATMPNNIFGAPIINEDLSRGIVRIPVVFIEFFPMIVFYGINKWLMEKKKRWLWVVGLAFFMIIMSVIRQVILLTAVLGLFFFFRNMSWKLKALMAAAVMGIVAFVLPMIPMYKTMIEFSETQIDENEEEENIRITAWRYYTYENQGNWLTPLIGNGVPSLGNSRWGIMFDTETEDNGCFTGDVGWAAFFWHFGIFATVALAVMIIKGIARRKGPGEQYQTYWLVFVFITSFASGPPLYYWQVLDIVMCLYFVFRKGGGGEPAASVEAEAPAAPRRLAVRAGYPQLRAGRPSRGRDGQQG